jgi:hypothetical protein
MQVGKALQDPIEGLSALGRIGVRFTQEQKDLIEGFVKTNDVASAQGIILQSLAQFKGQAQNVADPIIMLKNSFEDLRESIGLIFLPVINDLAIGIRGIVENFTAMVSTFRERHKDIKDIGIIIGSVVLTVQALKVAVLLSTGAIGLKIAALKAWTAAQIKLNIAMIANPIGIIITSIIALIGVIAIVVNRTIGFKQLWEYMKASFQIAWEWIKAIMSLLPTIVLGPIGAIFTFIFRNMENLKDMFKALMTGNVVEAGRILKRAVRSTVDDITGNFKNAVDNTKNIWSDAKLPPKEAPIEVTSPEEIAFQTQQALDAMDGVISSRTDEPNDDLLRRFNDFNLALRDERQRLADHLEEQKQMILEFYENGLLTTEQYLDHEKRLYEEHNYDMIDLNTKGRENALALTERKRKLGLATSEELLQAQSDYFDYVDAYYKEDTDTYLRMLEIKKAQEREFANLQFELQNDRLSMTDPHQAQLEAQKRAIEQRREMLIQAGMDEIEITEWVTEATRRLEQDAYEAREKAASRGLKNIADTLAKSGKQGFEIAKAFRIADIVMTTPSAAMKAFNSLVGIPVVGPALAKAAYASTIAMGAMQLNEVRKAKPPRFEKGGLLRGNSHSSGGILIEAEGNEYITNKRRVGEIGTHFFDFINFAPLQKVREFLSGLSGFTIPTFATGGLISSNLPVLSIPNIPSNIFQSRAFSNKGIEDRLDAMSDRLAYNLELIERKTTDVIIHTQNNAVRYIQEHNKALAEYRRKTT